MTRQHRICLLACCMLVALGGIGKGVEMRTDPVVLEGASITLDDALFTGCLHNAFEGEIIMQPDGAYKSGEQGIHRTKGILYGAGTTHNSMSITFTLAAAPAGKVNLVLKGLNDALSGENVLEVSLNGRILKTGSLFRKNDISQTKNFRYQVGWKEVAVAVPADTLKAGENTLTIENTTSVFTTDTCPYVYIDFVRFDFPAPTKLTITERPIPTYYYGLSEGAEVNIWPAINVGNRICLLTDGDIEYNFFVTFPYTEQNKKAAKTLHILTDGAIEITDLNGVPIAGAQENGKLHYTLPTARVVAGPTPHPSQGVRVFMKAKTPFEGKTLTAWVRMGETDGLRRTYALRGATLEPLAQRVENFQLSIWSGGVPSEPERQDAYIAMINRAGFNHMFTGANATLNRKLKAAGFTVYPRFGWFGRGFTIPEEKKAFAAIDAGGHPLASDYCPLAILEHADDPHLGKYFASAQKHAREENIDGLCVDYELGAVWCYCDRCLELFRRETGLQVADRAELSGSGRYADAYRDFGRRRNRDLLGKISDVMKEVNPKLRYTALASASDMPAYWWDGRTAGRHALQELTKKVDGILASAYFYNLPGGMKSVRPLVGLTRQYAQASGRDVEVGLISPLASTVSETPRFLQLAMPPDLLRLHILLSASAGARGLSLFRGDCFDGEYYLASRKAMGELALLEPYLMNGIDRSFEVNILPAAEIKYTLDLKVAENFMSRVPWHPDVAYQYDAVQFTKDYLLKERVVLLFNYSSVPLPVHLQMLGLYDPSYTVSDVTTGKELGTLSRMELEAGKPVFTIPPVDCLMLKLTTAGG